MKSISVVLLILFSASMAFAQSAKVDVVPLRIGGVNISFPLEADETGVVPPADAATAYVQAVMGKQMRFTQCFFVLEAEYRRKLISGAATSESEDRKGLRSMIVVTSQACDAGFLRTARDAALASTKDKRALADRLREVQTQAAQDGGAAVSPLKLSPEEAARQIGPVGLIAESPKSFTVGLGSNDEVVISTYVCAASRLVVFVQWTDQKGFPYRIERAKAFSEALDRQTKTIK
jgi:hypothetical protein